MNKLAVAVVLALSGAGVASAQTFHVTGSTAYRVADVSAEVQVCGGATAKATYFGSSLTGANISIVENSTGSLKFENNFSGSIAGDEALVSNVHLTFPTGAASPEVPATISTVGTATAPASGGNGIASGSPVNTESVVPDIAFSDVSFDTADQIIEASSDATTAQPKGSLLVGIVPFVFVANGSTDVTSKLSGLSMDPQKFTNTWASAGSTLSFFTGVHADEAVSVIPMGRDVDSGTRSTALAETGYGLSGSGVVSSPVGQSYPYDNATDASNGTTAGVIGLTAPAGTPIGAFGPVPEEVVDGFDMATGDGGYNSGGNLATAMSTAYVSGTTDTVVMTYLGVSDANSALTATGTNRQDAFLMSYNGSTFDPRTLTPTLAAANAAKIYEGQYTFWGFEHLNFNSIQSATATEAAALQSALNSGLDQESSNGVTATAMTVTRSDDGQNVQPK